MRKKRKDDKIQLTDLLPVVVAFWVAFEHHSLKSSVRYIRKGRSGYTTKFHDPENLNKEDLKHSSEIAASFVHYIFDNLSGEHRNNLSDDELEIFSSIGCYIKFLIKCSSILATRKFITGHIMEKIFKDMGYSW